MRCLPVVMICALLTSCVPKLVLREGCLPVIPADDLILPARDTTVIGTITMLSDKRQSLDLVEIQGDSFPQGAAAYRRARLAPDLPVAPYYGGVIEARVKPIERSVFGYMISVQLLEWKEIPVSTEVVREEVQRLLARQGETLQRLVEELGFRQWASDGVLQLEGYDPGRKICIYSMAGEYTKHGIIEEHPVLIVWATPEGKLKHVALIKSGRMLERR